MVDVVISIVAKVVELLLYPIGHQIRRSFNYNNSIHQLQGEVDKLKGAQERVIHLVEEATRSGEEIELRVEDWLKKVHTDIEEAEKVLKDEDKTKKKCFMGLCPNFKTCYKVSRAVEEQTQACAKLCGEGNFDRVSYRVRPEHNIVLKNYETFESRTSVLEAIMEALIEPDVKLIGVYGMSGVGKTTIVRKIAELVKKERIFDEVVLAVVTQNPDFARMQGDIADKLYFQFRFAETVGGRADRLRQRLKKEKKIIVILDDLWEKLDLEELGIPYGDDHKGCKVLITSRQQNVLSQMGTQKDFELGVLEESEAWDLFKKMVADVVNDPSLQSIAPEVAKRCAGLPLVIVVVARALKNRGLYAWKDALVGLKRSGSDEIDKQVFSALELSYNFLRGEEIKSLFLLCAQSRPNFISIQELFMKAFGLGIIRRSNALEEVRNRLHTLLDDLKASCLLLEHEDGNQVVKMHDIVHSFAVSVASRYHHVYKVAPDTILTEWPNKDVFKNCTAICLLDCKFPELPELLECPILESFIMESMDPSLKIPDNLFIRTKNLKVLSLGGIKFSSLPSSLKFLENLRTLCFYRCDLEEVAIIGDIKNLLVLSFCKSKIIRLPGEISQLSGLRLLELRHCQGHYVIPPNVLSCLIQLEDLYIEETSVQWEVESLNNQGNIANLAELKLLPKLSSLDIHITDAKMLPKDLFPGKLERYRIFIGDGWEWSGAYETSRTLKLKLNTSTHLDDGIKALLETTEDLYLDDMVDFKNILYELDVQGFPQMKHLHVQNSLGIHYVINSIMMGSCVAFPRLESLFLINLNNMEKICHGRLTVDSFSNLRKLEVRNCGKMRNLFSFYMVKSFLSLEELKVTDCKSMEGIVAKTSEYDGNHDGQIKLTHLRILKLEYLPQFMSFCMEAESTSMSGERHNMAGSNEIVSESELGAHVPFFNDKVVFPNLEELQLSTIKVEKMWCNQLIETSCYVKKLSTLRVVGCKNLKYLFTSSMIGSLAQLKWLEIYDCKLMENIIMPEAVEGDMMRKKLFPKLVWLKLKSLPKIKQFCCGDLIECPSMKELLIEKCPNLKAFTSPYSTSTYKEATDLLGIRNSTLFDEKVAFPMLEKFTMCGPSKLKMIWHNELYANSFSKLRELKVEFCKDLLKIFPSITLTIFQNVEKLSVSCCDSLEEVFDMIDTKQLQIEASSQMRDLELTDLPNLKCVWNGDPQGVLSFQNLRYLRICRCKNLKSLFPVSVARYLTQLGVVYIFHCSSLEEIVDKEGGVEEAPKFLFPRLKEISLQIAPELKSFYPGMHTLECPLLEVLRVYHCESLQTFASESHDQQNKDMMSQLEFQTHQPLFSFRKIIPKLKVLVMTSADAAVLCQGQYPEDLFDNIWSLELCCFHDEWADFLFDIVLKFQNMHSLLVTRCHFKELFASGIIGKDKYASTLARIKGLQLWDLPNMRHIWNQESPSDQVLPYLATLSVNLCNSLINLAPSSASL